MKAPFTDLKPCIVILLLALLGPVIQGAAEKPNIIFMMVDDLGYAGVGYHGSDIVSPNIDQLATNGVRLESTGVAAACFCQAAETQ